MVQLGLNVTQSPEAAKLKKKYFVCCSNLLNSTALRLCAFA